MSNAHVVVIGGGFAGISAAVRLRRLDRGIRVSLLDKKITTDFLPTLPDTIGRGIRPAYLSYPLGPLAARHGITFRNEEVSSLDLAKKQVATGAGVLGYDYCVIASGSETNFYGNKEIEGAAFKVDAVRDAEAILKAFEGRSFEHYLVAGGGYTGVEVATNIARYLKERGLKGAVTIIERAPSILGPLPEWMKAYVRENLHLLGITVYVNSGVEKYEGGTVRLTTGTVFNDALLVWAAGVRTADFIQRLPVEKNPQGRIKVDEYLRINESCFAAGDTSWYAHKGAFLRMSVQFAISQGEVAAENVVRSMRGRGLRRFTPADPGYIIPMANNKACGNVMGFEIKGTWPIGLHFLMCVLRSYGWRNRWGIIRDLFKGGGR